MLLDIHGQPLNPKLRADMAKPVLGWIVCKMFAEGTYKPVVDGRTGMLAIAPDADQAVKLAETLCQRELQPQGGKMVEPGQQSSIYAVLKLVGQDLVQVKLDDAQTLLNGGKRA